MKMTHVIVEGLVQGVWFRDSTQRQALALHLSGWVRNLANGSVEVMLAGPDQDVSAMLDWLKHGPPRARVDNLIIEHFDSDEQMSEFEVRYHRS
jgi:acylphosphatase